MPDRRVTVTLDEPEQKMVRGFRYSAQPWASIVDKLRAALEQPARAVTVTCQACGAMVRLISSGRLAAHYDNSTRRCRAEGTLLYEAPGCTCGGLARDCTCGAVLR